MPSDKTDRTDKTPKPDASAIRAALRRASPAGWLAAHEATVEAMLADGFDCDLAHYRRHVECARAELDRGHIDRARVHIRDADYALKEIDHAHDTDRLRGAKTLQGARDAGELRARETAHHREDVMAEIERLLRVKNNVSWAAATAFKRGHGTSAEANRRLWNRHRPPKG